MATHTDNSALDYHGHELTGQTAYAPGYPLPQPWYIRLWRRLWRY